MKNQRSLRVENEENSCSYKENTQKNPGNFPVFFHDRNILLYQNTLAVFHQALT